MTGQYSYKIAGSETREDGRFDIRIDGPGLPNPLLLSVASKADADAFIEVLNLAYAQGVLSQSRKRNKMTGGK